jgi:predicted acetyltransferase
MRLIRPSRKYQRSFLAALEEVRRQSPKQRGSFHFDLNINSGNFHEYLKKRRDEARGVNLKRGRVQQTKFWLVDKGEYIGQLNLRHRLNASLRKIGGHIGYWIRPSQRRRGYGKKILALGLKEAKKLGIKNALLTCDNDNIGSIKIIEASGGVFKNEIIHNKKEKPKRRYWIKNQ